MYLVSRVLRKMKIWRVRRIGTEMKVRGEEWTGKKISFRREHEAL